MKLQERLKREYRLLALAVVFFGAGGIFFWYDASVHPSPAPGSEQGVNVTPGSGSDRGGTILDPDFASYPPPAQFHTFAYDKSGINGSSTLVVSTQCNAAYVAVLIFPSMIDYRADITAAVYNHASPCDSGHTFTTTIATSDIATAPFGSYYYFTADEGTIGPWYNPR